MRRAVPLLVALPLSALLLSGCLIHNISASERLRDSVVGLNDEARWGRMDLARERVAPAYRAQWRERRAGWGEGVQIADVEILGARLGEEDDATSTVAIRWYSYDTMTLRQSVVRQEWRSAGNTYVLLGEEVVDGDPRLFPSEEETEGEGPAGRDGGSAPVRAEAPATPGPPEG